jgi:hypothetical protein
MQNVATASLVEDDQPRERGEPLEEVRESGQLPDVGQMRDPSEHENDVDPTVAHDLVGDVDLAAARVPSPREHCESGQSRGAAEALRGPSPQAGFAPATTNCSPGRCTPPGTAYFRQRRMRERDMRVSGLRDSMFNSSRVPA